MSCTQPSSLKKGGAKVSTIIVTYNGSRWIKRCLDSLASSLYPIDVIVVDNCSSDNTMEILYSYPQIHCISLSKNVGFGRANNIGMSYALQNCAEYVFLLNQDAFVSPGAIEVLVNCAAKNSAWGILSPIHLDDTGLRLDGRFSAYISTPHILSDLYFGRLQETYSLPFVNAAAWLITRSCLEHVGGFDPLFFLYGEDDDLYSRVLFHGFQAGIVTSATIFHSRVGGTAVESHKARRFALLLLELKHAKGTFVFGLLRWIKINLFEMANSLISRNPQYTLTMLFALIRIVLQLPIIYRHRKLGLQQGQHWLFLNNG